MSDTSNLNELPNDDAAGSSTWGRNQVIWTIWLTYGAFYFCRTNIGVALPGIEEELGFTKTQMGNVLFALKIAYAMGQFINGQLAERLSPRKMLALGMFGSAALNVAFGFGTGMYFFLFIWACNGYCQSLGWPPCMRVIGNWIPVLQRGKAIGIIGTGYQLTLGLTYAISGVAVYWFGWKGVFMLPPAILITAALVMLLFLRESPEEASLQSTPQGEPKQKTKEQYSFMETMRLTLKNPALWLLAVSLGMLNACRYGFLDWGVSHLVAIESTEEIHEQINNKLLANKLSAADQNQLQQLLKLDLTTKAGGDTYKQLVKDGLLPKIKKKGLLTLKAAIKYTILPFGALLGAFLAGWATDRFFGSRRAPVIFFLLIILGCLTLIYDQTARTSFVGTMFLLAGIGFTIYGPQVLLVGTAPADLARDGTAAAAAGFVNCIGYFGAAFAGDKLTGYIADNYGWQIAIYGWAGWAFGAAITVAFLWTATGFDSHKERGT